MSALNGTEVFLREMAKPGMSKTSQDPTTAAIDALRSAVVAQTALLRELSQQVRLSFEAQQAEYLSQQFEVAKQLAALAERLDLQAKMFRNIHDRFELYSGFPEALLQVKGHLAAVEAKLPGRKTGRQDKAKR